MAKRSESLLSAAKAMPPTKRVVCFIERQPPKVRKELLELRKEYSAGKLPSHATIHGLWRLVRAKLGPIVGSTAFSRFMKGET